MSQRPKLEIPVGSEAKVSLLFDNPKTGLTPKGEWRLYGVNHNGVEKSFFASDKAHEIMQHYNKGDSVLIEHKKIQDGKTVYLVSPVSVEFKKSKDDQDKSIKCGMAFNNATRLVMSEHEFDGDVMKRVELIKQIMPKMYEIALMQPEEEELF